MSRSRAQKRAEKQARNMADGRYWQTGEYNWRAVMHYYTMFANLAMTRFKWVNLPDSVDSRFLEWCLLNYGSAVAFKPWFSDKLMITKGNGAGTWNAYDNPTEFYSWGNKWSYRFSSKGGTIIYDNPSRISIVGSLEMFAREFADIDRTCAVNRRVQKTPWIIEAPEEQRDAALQWLAQVDSNEVAIIGNTGLTGMVNFNVLTSGAPYVEDKMQINKRMRMNELYTFLGIDNANQDKKERVQSEEVQANNGQISMSRLVSLDERNRAAERINKLYGTEIYCVWNSDILTHVHNAVLDPYADPNNDQGVNDGNFYD